MKKSVWAKAKTAILFLGLIFVFAQIFSVELPAQKRRKTPPTARTAKKKTPPKRARVALNLPKVTQIDTPALQNLLKRDGENAKPLLINFWATWCDPCREEFPDLVKIDADYKGKIDFITISLDYLSEINGDVPKFLAQMKAGMPAYLLKTENESEAIALVSKDWQGGLPFTILFDSSGKEAYVRQGKIKPETIRAEIDKTLNPPQPQSAFEKGKLDAEKDLAAGKIIIKANYTSPRRRKTAEEHGIKLEFIFVYKPDDVNYINGYNSLSEAAVVKKFGEEVLNKIKSRLPPPNYPADVVQLTLSLPSQKIN
ncbi:MAG TPA: thioredoxin-like domain-containing protein [Pyrinomonadaceae bacterium]|jgi:thiol-disulfide isomerase/thioredoxin